MLIPLMPLRISVKRLKAHFKADLSLFLGVGEIEIVAREIVMGIVRQSAAQLVSRIVGPGQQDSEHRVALAISEIEDFFPGPQWAPGRMKPAWLTR